VTSQGRDQASLPRNSNIRVDGNASGKAFKTQVLQCLGAGSRGGGRRGGGGGRGSGAGLDIGLNIRDVVVTSRGRGGGLGGGNIIVVITSDFRLEDELEEDEGNNGTSERAEPEDEVVIEGLGATGEEIKVRDGLSTNGGGEGTGRVDGAVIIRDENNVGNEDDEANDVRASGLVSLGVLGSDDENGKDEEAGHDELTEEGLAARDIVGEAVDDEARRLLTRKGSDNTGKEDTGNTTEDLGENVEGGTNGLDGSDEGKTDGDSGVEVTARHGAKDGNEGKDGDTEDERHLETGVGTSTGTRDGNGEKEDGHTDELGKSRLDELSNTHNEVFD